MSAFCRHFTGLMSGVCAAGVAYEQVKLPGAAGAGVRLPCIEGHGVAEVCGLVSYYTAEEKAEQAARINRLLAQFAEDLGAGRCPICHEPARQRQVGRCVYGDPCGHRMFQGRAGKAVPYGAQ